MALEQFQTEENIPAEVPAEIPAKKPEVSKEDLYANTSAIRLQKKRAEYDQHIQRLIDKFSNRQLSYNPQMLALSEGLLTPGKTGSFFEGFGTGMKGYREAGEKMQEQDITNAKLENELRSGQIGQIEKDYALEQELAGIKYRKDIAARRLKGSPTGLAVTNMGDKPLIQSLIGTPSSETMITMADIDLAPPSARKELIEDYKRQQEDIKIQQEGFKATKFAAPFKGVVEGTVNQALAVARVLNDPHYQSASEDDQRKMMAITYDYIGLNERPSGAKDKTQVPEIETASEKETRLKGEAEAVKTEAEASTKKAETFFKAADTAQQRRISADNIERLAKTNPKFFDTLQNPNVRDTVGRLINTGVQTPWGSISIDAKDASAALGNLMDDTGFTSLLGWNKSNITRQDREAYAMFLRDLAIMQVAQRRSSNDPGQGSISDYEQRLFASTSFMKDDDARVQQLKAKMIKLQAKMDEDLAGILTTWQEKNKYKPIKNFLYTSPEFKQFKQSYEDKLEKLRNQNADLFGQIDQVDTSSREVAPTSTGNYVDIIQQEKERRKLR
jgi:hypothetical protein